MNGYTGSTIAILTEGMGGRLRTKNGQLVPLKDRLSKFQLAKRTEKVEARRTVAELLEKRQKAFMAGVAMSLAAYFNRGFFGRMKWVLVGR